MDGLKWVLVATGGAAILGLALFAARRASARRQRRLEAWRRFADERGFRLLEPSGPWYRRSPYTIEGTLEGIPFRLDTYIVSTGETQVTYTRVRASLERPFHGKLDASPRTFLTPVGEALGWRSLRTGDDAFDRKMFVRSASREQALRLLDENVRSRTVAFERSPRLQLADREARVWWRGEEADPSVLEAACRLVAAIVRACANA